MKNQSLFIFLTLVALLFSSLGITPAAAWTGSGHFVLEPINYDWEGTHFTRYQVAPNFRQAARSPFIADSIIHSDEAAHLYVNFDYDTTGKTIYLVYTMDGSEPTKSNGIATTATFSQYQAPDSTWVVELPQQTAGTTVKYRFYISDNTLANGYGRVSGNFANRAISQYQTSWNETDGAYFEYWVPLQVGPNFLVNTSEDSDDGSCDPVGTETECTLREAINAANSSPDADIITFAGNYTITLSDGQLPTISSQVTINGNGAANTIIQANENPKTSGYGVFDVEITGNLTLDALTVRHGVCYGLCNNTLPYHGGGVFNAGTLTVTNSAITNNSAAFGGGIYSIGVASILDSVISDNDGSGISNGGTLTITNSAISNNHTVHSNGGGIDIGGGPVMIINSTISGNSANLTEESYDGGGIFNNKAVLTITNSTIANNSSAGVVGGLYNGAEATLHYTNTILADAVAGADCYNDGGVIGVNTSNLVENNAAGSNACGSAFITDDPKLGGLSMNGGSTPTQALLAGSPAMNAGDSGSCPLTDQRGVTRPKLGLCDIGAFEAEDAAAPTIDTFNPGISSASLNIPIPAFIASDDISVTGYLITASAVQPILGDSGWAGTAPTVFTVPGDGNYTLYPWVKDAIGNISAVFSTPRAILVDTTAPNTTITDNPSSPSVSRDATFVFNGSDGSGAGVIGFECSLDGSPFAACSSPKAYTSLSDGSHTFQARAVDALGNKDASPATYTWKIDTTAPATTILANPTNPSLGGVSFTFSGDDGTGVGGLTFECALDGGSFTDCTSPKDYTALSDGNHTFQVRASDSLGNTDATPANYTWKVDVTAPETSILTKPSDPSTSSNASFTFSGDDGSGAGGLTFECALDGGSFAGCVSPVNLNSLSNTSHTFQVRATDSLGNADATPASYTWLVDTNGAPTNVALSNSSVAENKPAGTLVGTLSATDPDAGETFTYTLACAVPGADDASFAVAGNSLNTAAAFNFEAKNAYTLCLRVTDSGSKFLDKNFTITVADVKEEAAKNGGFNLYTGASKIPTTWKAVKFAATDGKDTTVKREGAASVKIIGQVGQIKTLTQAIALAGKKNDTFTISYWVKATKLSTAGLCQVQALFYNGTTAVGGKTLKCPVGTTYNWKQVKLDFGATGDYTKIVLKLTFSKTLGDAWFDWLSLTR